VNTTAWAAYCKQFYDRLLLRYGIAAASFDIILEPENCGGWVWGARIGNAIVALRALLPSIEIVAPSNTNAYSVVATADDIVTVTGAEAALDVVGYHRYGGGNTDAANIKAWADARIKRTGMTEWFDATIDTVIDDLVIGGVSIWQKWGIAGKVGVGSNPQSSYYIYDEGTDTVSIATNSHHMALFFPFVRAGAERIDVTSAEMARLVAFENANGSQVVLMQRTTASGVVNFSGLAPGSYGVRHIPNASTTVQDNADVTVNGSGNVSFTVPTGHTVLYKRDARAFAYNESIANANALVNGSAVASSVATGHSGSVASASASDSAQAFSATESVASATASSVAEAHSGSVAQASPASVASAHRGSVASAVASDVAEAYSGAASVASATASSTASAHAGSTASASASDAAAAHAGSVASASASDAATAHRGSVASAAASSIADGQSSGTSGSVASATAGSVASAHAGSVAEASAASTAIAFSGTVSIASAVASSVASAHSGAVASASASSAAAAHRGSEAVALCGSIATGFFGSAAEAAAFSTALAHRGSYAIADGFSVATGIGPGPDNWFYDPRYIGRGRRRQHTARDRKRNYGAPPS
jgi:hypothetical protein